MIHFSKANVKLAVAEALGGVTVAEVSRKYHIPASTIRAKKQNKYNNERPGALTVLSEQEENELVGWIFYCCKQGFPGRIIIGDEWNASIEENSFGHYMVAVHGDLVSIFEEVLELSFVTSSYSQNSLQENLSTTPITPEITMNIQISDLTLPPSSPTAVTITNPTDQENFSATSETFKNTRARGEAKIKRRVTTK
ncbi:hypothetical protein KQX54_012328 [Cotesia glomerata]|uniref:HTH psq-type domain-containing protein n=1 Tax=Cotesia glomerata TaxID=32391 RepID=A0AAV7IKN8_COTGL|nr:hypothetical protein KQX54_012328 [Cotesia glomerata]